MKRFNALAIVLSTGALVATATASLAQDISRDAQGSSYASRDEWWLMSEDGCSVYVAEFGAGPPLVVVHGGFGAEHSYLLDALGGIASRHRLVFYDQRGSLRSPYKVFQKGGAEACPDSLLTAGNHVADLERLRRELGLDRMTLVAHSMGAFIALSYLERFPQRVAGLVLLAPGVPLKKPVEDEQLLAEQKAAVNALFERPEIEAEKKKAGVDRPPLSDKQQIAEWRIRYASANLYDVSKWRQMRGGMAFHNTRAGSAAWKTMPQTYDFTEALRNRSCPTSVILGDHDISDMGARVIRRQLAGVPRVELTVIRNAGHALWVDQPGGFAAAVERALALCA
jgi:pimeloyl-ACP methyl ester carboxylesterase